MLGESNSFEMRRTCMADKPLPIYPAEAYRRDDPGDDRVFYAQPRKLVHIDDAAIAAVGQLYGELLPKEGRLLDLMSSWRSHLPPGFEQTDVLGLGMNAPEMADNPQLREYEVHDLNRDPQLPFEDAAFGGAMCTVSIQYLTHPVEVFAEVHRVLQPGSPFVLTFSSRCFPTKAVALWLSSTSREHMEIVKSYFTASANWKNVKAEIRLPDDKSDPLYAVWGYA